MPTWQEIRAEIDRIDRDVIAALGERFQYVKAAAKFKSNRGEVAAPERVTAMLEHRRNWAGGGRAASGCSGADLSGVGELLCGGRAAGVWNGA